MGFNIITAISTKRAADVPKEWIIGKLATLRPEDYICPTLIQKDGGNGPEDVLAT